MFCGLSGLLSGFEIYWRRNLLLYENVDRRKREAFLLLLHRKD
jgi:hypothetical protein